MNRQQHLGYCKVCNLHKFDSAKGIICGITNEIADFEESCPDYDENTDLKNQFENKKTENYIARNTASQSSRFINYIIDTFLVYLLIIGFSVTYGILLGVFSPESIETIDEGYTSLLITLISSLSYYLFFETVFGRTVGKYATKTKVVDEHGNKPDFITVLIRSFCRYIPFDALSFLFASETGWHDSISKTKVVEIRKN